ncbi:MAG: FAD-binding oxidoreductase [Micropruina sp.]|uniref:FAD-binding oxidoreductase n=1 Tax=Micropruina sp. TaxID=2737536 RepID=UPI0039E6304B
MAAARRRPFRFRARHGLAVFVVLILVSYGISMADLYSGVPQRPKDCLVRQVAAEPNPPMVDAGAAFPAWLVQRRGTVNDASCLNRTEVYGVARPGTEDELRTALGFAREHRLEVSLSGTRHSMGGQAAAPGALIIDLTALDRIVVDQASGSVRVGGGAVWRQVLEAVHARGLSIRAMPSIDVLSVGGTIAANAHGVDFRTGSLASTVRSLRVMLADGTVHTLDRTRSPELFHAVIGGYGLLGVILEAELDVVPDESYRLEQQVIATADLPGVFGAAFDDPDRRLMYAHLSTVPSGLFEEAVVYTHRRLAEPEPIPPLRHEPDSGAARLLFNLARHRGPGQWLKWTAQRDLLPHVRQCTESRNEALRAAEACLVSRNQAMYNDLALLRNRIPQYTDILQEYFLPPDALVPFLRSAAAELNQHQAVLLNASVRVVHASPVLLDYAQGDRYSVVLYLSQDVSAAGNRDMAELTRMLIDRALAQGGTFYLPYQQHYTRDDLTRAYPRVEEFFALKRRHDPDLLFMNSFYRRFA